MFFLLGLFSLWPTLLQAVMVQAISKTISTGGGGPLSLSEEATLDPDKHIRRCLSMRSDSLPPRQPSH
ncbi:uncharacterized [Tachysurus ichikawai]